MFTGHPAGLMGTTKTRDLITNVPINQSGNYLKLFTPGTTQNLDRLSATLREDSSVTPK